MQPEQQSKQEPEQRIEESLEINKSKLKEHLLEILKPSIDKDKQGELASAHVETFDFFKKGRINKSDCYRMIVTENFKERAKQETNVYILKKYDSPKKDEYSQNDESQQKAESSKKAPSEIEKQILGISNVIGSRKYWFTGTEKEFRIFEYAFSPKYKEADFENLLLLKYINDPSENLEDQIKLKQKVSSLDIVEALNPINLLHDYIPSRHYIDKKEPNGKEIGIGTKEEVLEKRLDIPDFDYSGYLKNVEAGIYTLFDADDSKKKSAYESLEKVSNSFMCNEDFKTTIQSEGYPHHDFITTLVDASNVCRGPRALHLGCLIGHPAVFNRLDNQKEAIPDLIKGYLWRRDRLKEEFKLHTYIQPIDKDFLESSVYIGAILGNLYMCSKLDDILEDEKNEFKEAIKNQIDFLQDKNKYDKDINNLFRAFSHVSYPNQNL